MEFDRLCKEVERRFPEHRPMLEESRLFCIPTGDWPTNYLPHERMERWHPDEAIVENFRLPFETISVDWGESCAAMRMLPNSRKLTMIGSHSKGNGTTFFRATVNAFPGEFVLDASRLGRVSEVNGLEVFVDGEPVVFSMSDINLKSGGRGQYTENSVSWKESPPGSEREGYALSIDGKWIDFRDRDEMKKAMPVLTKHINELESSIHTLLANVAYLEINAAIMCVLVICEPSRFIVEQSLAAPKVDRGTMIQRSPYRPHYIALKPGEIKKRYLYDEHDPTGIVVTPHERRGHFRKLTSEKFVAKRGQVLWIKPCWVGKTEGVRGKNKYVVRLDL